MDKIKCKQIRKELWFEKDYKIEASGKEPRRKTKNKMRGPHQDQGGGLESHRCGREVRGGAGTERSSNG